MILVLDTNALWETRAVRRLAELVRKCGFRLQVPALVHAERVAQVRRTHGESFDIAVVQSFIDTHHIEVVGFDRACAERFAEDTWRRFPDAEKWHAAKRTKCATRFHVNADAGVACPSTVDWFIAYGHKAQGTDRVVLVTNDGGTEFDGDDVLPLSKAIELVEASVAQAAKPDGEV